MRARSSKVLPWDGEARSAHVNNSQIIRSFTVLIILLTLQKKQRHDILFVSCITSLETLNILLERISIINGQTVDATLA